MQNQGIRGKLQAFCVVVLLAASVGGANMAAGAPSKADAGSTKVYVSEVAPPLVAAGPENAFDPSSGTAAGVTGVSGDVEPSEPARCGAVCKDGSRSGATGSGACSHHGGVKSWLLCETGAGDSLFDLSW